MVSEGKRNFRVHGAADYLGLSPSYLNKLRTTGGGPIFSAIGKRAIIYAKDDLDAWLASKRRRSTSEVSPICINVKLKD
jgi:hypothetical protein